VNGLEEILRHPQVEANGAVVEKAHPTLGSVRTLAPTVKLDRTPSAVARTAPALGEHTREVLAESSLDSREIDALFASGAVG
jgi:formyl-CoA transferase